MAAIHKEKAKEKEAQIPLAVDRESFNRNLQKLIHANPTKQSEIRPEKRKPAKIIHSK